MKIRHIALHCVVALGALASAGAAEPPTTPVLRIEAGMHTAPINRVSADKAGRLALTVSQDKTARLWELPGGRLLRVLRPPLGTGSEGKLYCGALSPDGSLAAVGGWIRSGNGGNDMDNNIHLFDTATGRLVRRLSGLPDVVDDLAFSASGRWLAAGLGSGGIRIWEMASGREIGRDPAYGDRCRGLDWQGDERLVSTCIDGKVRLYVWEQEPPARLIPSRSTVLKQGKRPFAARFSPDGQRIAVGFEDTTAVAVLAASDLLLLFAPDTAGVDNGNLSSVAWSADGVTLAAGGTWQKIGGFPVRLLGDAGRGRPRDVGVATSNIKDLRPLLGGGLLFGAADPSWGILSGSGTVSKLGAPPIADYRGNWDGFRLSVDASTVAFGFEVFGKSPASFDLLRREIRISRGSESPSATLRAPRTTGLDVSDWKDTVTPKLKGQPLKLEPYEISLSLAIAPDASFFLLGTWYLRCFSANGAERWQVPAPGTVWSVNMSADGRLAVAAYGDGTIRWHRADTGQELLAFFPHADRKRWVLWTPGGYYDCSPGAEDLIGWHVNRGNDQAADFFSASSFRNVFYRPDVISRMLQTRDLGQALSEANRALGRPEAKPEEIATVITRLSPPVVELETGGVFGKVTLSADATEVPIRYRVRQTGAEPPTKVAVRFNGRSLNVAAPLPKAGEAAEAKIPVPAGMTGELSLFAEHRLAVSEPAVLRVERDGPANPRQPNLYLVSVGVGELKMNHAGDGGGAGKGNKKKKTEPTTNLKEGDIVLDDLPHVADDARQIAEAFDSQKGRHYARVVTNLLLNKAATAPALREAFRNVARQAGPEDVAIFFFSGHGVVDAKAGFYLATHEVDPKKPAATALTGAELATLLEGIKARTVLALDTCHSGGALGGTRMTKVITSPNDLAGLINELSSAEQGTIVLSSSAASEQSFEDPKKGGVFTQALREGVMITPSKGGTITCVGLQSWVKGRVPELVAALVEGVPDAPQQTPACVMPKGVPDFPIAQPNGGATWRTYPPGQAPPAKFVTLDDVGTLADRGKIEERLYLRGDFRVTASSVSRAVLRDAHKPDEQSPRVLVEYPFGAVPPKDKDRLSRDASLPYQIYNVRRGTDGVVTIWVREITQQ